MPGLTVAMAMLAALCTAACAAEPVEKLSTEEAARWSRQLLPLPRQLELTGRVVVRAEAVRIALPEPPTELDRCAAEELVGRIGTTPADGPGEFTVRLERADDESLRGLRNADQAYRIEPDLQGEGCVGLTCTALTEAGTYYAVQTLKQLLGEPQAAGRVSLPVCRIVDWPDLEERGEWGGSVLEDLERMAAHKFNLAEVHATLTVDAGGVGHAEMKPELMERARKHAVRIVPIIHHLEQLQGTGMFEAFPQLKATGVPNSICFAQPELVTLLSQWLAELGRIDGVFDVMIWLSEEGQGCQCAECARDDRFVNETRACLAAWEQAKGKCPGLGLRLLLTQASHGSNDKVLAAVPEGVKVSYYDGGRTYNTSRKPMIYPLLEEYAQGGRWLGVYPTLGANWLTVGPFSNPEFVHARLTEFVDKGLSCLVGYVIPANWLYPVNVEGAAEWSWNAHGRSPREFTLAYADRHGLPGEPLADWVETLGPVSWDVYGSNFPFLQYYLRNIEKVADGTAGYALGTSMFGEFTEPAQFERDLAICDGALKLAEATGHPLPVVETRIVRAYVEMLQAVWESGALIQGRAELPEADRAAAGKWFTQFLGAASSIATLYPEWTQALGGDPAGLDRLGGTVTLVDDMATRIAALGERFGVTDPDRAYRRRNIGEWKTADFEVDRHPTRRLEVTPYLDGPGTYLFEPQYRSGSLGLAASRVALVSYPKDNPEDTHEEAADEHTCHAGSWVQDAVYRLELPAHDPNRGYAVLASVGGGPTTEGVFTFRKARPGE